jgi:copper chaperone CopZ
VKKALSGVAGVKKVELDFDAKVAKVTVESDKKNVDALIKAVKEKGFEARVEK